MMELPIQAWITPELAQRFAGSLLHFVWQGALIAMIAAIILRSLANRSAESRYAVSVAALLLMLAAPVLTFIFYAQTGLATRKLLLLITENVRTSTQSISQTTITATWTQWIVTAWFIGVLACAIRLIAGWRISRSLTKVGTSAVPSEIQQSFNEIMNRLALTKPVRLLASLRIDTPVAVGWLRPAVLLPVTALTGLDEDQLRAVFAHELAHIRRHDFLVNMIQRGVESILFYHPAVWWLSARVRSEREHCCDDLAIQVCGDRSVYAQALIELERVRTVDPELAVAATGGRLTQRIHRVLGYRIVENDWQSAIAALLFVVVWVMMGVWQSDATLDAKPFAPPPVPASMLMESVATTPKLSSSLNAIAAIVTAAPLQPEPQQSAQPVQSTNAENSQTGVVEGTLRDDAGKPASGVVVLAIAVPADPPASMGWEMVALARANARTDNEGRYRLEGIPAGSYTIAAGRVELPTFYPGTLDVAASKIITVVHGATVANVNFAMDPMSKGLVPSNVVASSFPTFVGGGNQTGTFGPGGTLRLYVSIQIEGGGKTPIFANGRYPKLRLTKIDTNTSYEMWFADTVIGVPRNYTTIPDEYHVALEDLPEGYAVKTITYRADEPGLRFEDVLHGTLKISARANYAAGAGTPDAVGSPELPIAILLTRSPLPPTSGVRVTGTTDGIVDVLRPPNVGAYASAKNFNLLLDVGVYLSGKPGILYSDGTYEFAGVSPGLHSVILLSNIADSPKFAAAEVAVRDRDVEAVTLQSVQILPEHFFSPQALPVRGTDTTGPALSSITGQILDQDAHQPVASATIALTGAGGSARGYASTRLDTFRILNLLPGQYSLSVEAKGYTSKTEEITVGAENPPFNIMLTHTPKG